MKNSDQLNDAEKATKKFFNKLHKNPSMIPRPNLLMIDDGNVQFTSESISKDQADALMYYYEDVKNIPGKTVKSFSLDSVLMSDESCSLLLKGIES